MASEHFLTLGNVQFTHDEAPSELALSSSQSLAVHDLIGGRRIIQSLGVVWKPITWEGMLRGANAEYRSQQLIALQTQAKKQTLTYLSHSFDVVVSEYDERWKHVHRVDYRITVTVLKDNSGKVTQSQATSIDRQISSAHINARMHFQSLQSVDSNAAFIGSPLDAMGQAIDKAGPAASATGADAITAVKSIAAAISAVNTYKSTLNTSSPIKAVLQAEQLLANLTAIQKNYATGQAPKTITVSNVSLHEVAAQYYKDASLAGALQVANNLPSPFLPSGVPVSLVLPPLLSSSGLLHG